MLRTVLLRLWQQVTQGFVRYQADDRLDEAEYFRKFYQHELVETCRRLGYDIQSVEPNPDIDPMTTAVWVGSSPLVKKLGTYVRKVDFRASFKPAKNISMSQHLEANPELYEAHQAAVDDCLKHLDD